MAATSSTTLQIKMATDQAYARLIDMSPSTEVSAFGTMPQGGRGGKGDRQVHGRRPQPELSQYVLRELPRPG